MIVNFGTKMIPVSNWTKQIDIICFNDEQEITVLLAVSLTGDLLSPKNISSGKTTNCHPSVDVPSQWRHVTHSANQWSTTETMIEYTNSTVAPYMAKKRKQYGV